MAERNAAIRLCGKDGVKEWKRFMEKGHILKDFSQANICLEIDLK
ncbi:hypothetical protein wVul_0538 [Wolbachia endosymbiont of Armadillidium vulgare str. wVulC]|nr:hypothetical protein [Wolbachia endosymbiont of Armadillidium vulgare]KLT23335.1 hypothetical protein wVul_0538 [Wolbachia endosymbiont of Armadillidium vulgare str. wVulC]